MTTEPDDESIPGWQRSLLGTDPSVVIGSTPPTMNLLTSVTPLIAHRMGARAAELGVSREELLRRALRTYLVDHGLATVDEAEAGVRPRSNYVLDMRRKTGRRSGGGRAR
jgi:hypothetical protein